VNYLGLLIASIVVFVIAVPIVALVRAISAGRLGKQNKDSWQKLTQRVYSLESQLAEIQGRLKSQAIVLEQALEQLRNPSAGREGPAPATVAEPVQPSAPAAAPEAAYLEPPPHAAIPASLTPPTVPPVVGLERPPAPVAAAISPVPPPTFPSPAPATAHLPSPMTATPSQLEVMGALKASPRDTARRVLNMEEVLGTDWLNKLGMIILVIGIALFLAYEMRELGPAGKVLAGFAVSGALLGAGIFYERGERYLLLARAGIGGGWALVFFTTYAMYHVEAARVLNSQALDLALLLAVAAAMVAHTLRFNSQAVTGLAFLLAFATVTISHVNVYSLAAGAILALALVFIVKRRGWFELEVFGILSSYINHYYWLRHIIEPMHGHRHPFPEFYASAGLLVFYWLVFRVSYLLRRPANGEAVSTVAALLNSFLLLSVMKYQSVHPELAFRCLLALGVVEFVLGQLPVARRRRAAFVILSTIGVTFMVAALPFKYSWATLPILWLAEAEALLLAGVFTRELVFRRLGLITALLVALQLDRLALQHMRDPGWTGFPAGDWLKAVVVFATAVLILYGDAHWLPRRYRNLMDSRAEQLTLRVLSYAGGITALIAIGWLVPEAWVAVGFAVLALALAALAGRLMTGELLFQAHVLVAFAFTRTLIVNLDSANLYPHLWTRVATVGLVGILFYATARWSGLPRAVAPRWVSASHTWMASFLIGLLAWYELRPVGVAVAWMLLGLALFEIGRARSLSYLRLQAYLAFTAGFFRLFYVNFNASGPGGELSPRFYSTVPLALAFYYVYSVIEASHDAGLDVDRRWRAPQILCFFGTFAVAGLARFELDPDWVAAAWAALVLALLVIAWRYGKRIFLHQGLLLGVAVLLRGTLHNFYERSYFPAPYWQSRSLTVGATIALLVLALPFALRLKRPPTGDSGPQRRLPVRILSGLDRRPDLVLFFIPFLLLTVLLALEMPKGLVTVAWGVEAVGIFLLALWVGQRSYRLTGLGLLLVCVGKIVVLDVWGLQPRDRYLTFIVLGTALLGVSFLYTRYREAIRQYL
jgi:hypothetical protein